MASLHIVFDPNDRISNDPGRDRDTGIRSARLAIAEDLSDVDIYNVAKKLGEMLLEQISRANGDRT